MWQRVQRFLAFFCRDQIREPEKLRRVEDGFCVERQGLISQRVRWGDVRKITAYRYNGTRMDQMTVVFHVPSDDGWVEAKEESVGWSEVVEGMLRAFPTISRDWRFDVQGPREVACRTEHYCVVQAHLMRQRESSAQPAHFVADRTDDRLVALGLEYTVDVRPDPAHVVFSQTAGGQGRRTDANP